MRRVFRFDSMDFAFGEAATTLHAGPRSEMAEMFGSNAPAPATEYSFLGAAEWGRIELRKEIIV